MVRQIFDWLVGEQVSSSEIARRLRRSAGKTRRGGPWRNNLVGAILRNESYTGRYHYNKTRASKPKRRTVSQVYSFLILRAAHGSTVVRTAQARHGVVGFEDMASLATLVGSENQASFLQRKTCRKQFN